MRWRRGGFRRRNFYGSVFANRREKYLPGEIRADCRRVQLAYTRECKKNCVRMLWELVVVTGFQRNTVGNLLMVTEFLV